MMRTFISRLLTASTVAGIGFIVSAQLVSTPAFALDATGNISVTASLAESCTVTANNIGFGQLAYGADASVDSGFDVDCLEGTVYTISLDTGDNFDVANSERRMVHSTDATAFIPYTLHEGDPTIAPPLATSYTAGDFGFGYYVGNGTPQTYDLWGFVDGPDTSNKITGSYSDTVVVTVSY